MKDIIVSGRYRVEKKIGKGAYGAVWQGTDILTGDKVAIKLSQRGHGTESGFVRERVTYKVLGADEPRKQPAQGFPRLRSVVTDNGDLCILVMDLLGPSVESLNMFFTEKGKMSVRTVIMMARQAVKRLRTLHNKGLLHLDLKPANMMMGRGKDGNTLYLADFGITRRDDDPGTALHRQQNPAVYERPTDVTPEQEEGRGRGPIHFVGTDWFASLNIHKYQGYTYADDVESLAYSLAWLLKGTLPWEGLSALTVPSPRDNPHIMTSKEETTPEQLFSGLPTEFAKLLEHARSVAPGQKPDYNYLLRLLEAAWRKGKYRSNNIWDWTIYRHRELRQQAGMPVPNYSVLL